LAGGIGITPILAMGYELKETGRTFSLHYAVRDLSRAVFVEEMRAAFGGSFHLHTDDAQGRPALDVAKVLQETDAGAHVYCCGPGGFIDHVKTEALNAGWREDRIHFEKFTSQPLEATGSFRVALQKQGVEFDVPEGASILDTLLDAGIDVPFSCESGICGTCLCDVVQGIPDHHDSFQTDAEKAANTRIAICCSRSKTDYLILDI
jgi:vanillate O-demethylase ferredoxin subunit